MTTHKVMLARASDLLDDAYEVYGLIEAHCPDRLPLAQQMLDDTIRVYNLLEASQRLSRAASLEVEARLVRANLISEALNAPVQ